MTKVLRQPTVAELQQHARELARAFKLRLIESDQLQPDEALALSPLNIALVSTIVDETTYAVALHELGHCASATGSIRGVVTGERASLQRIEEDAAWTWARHYALVWTPVMDALAQWAEGTYAARPAPPAPTQPPPPPQIDWSRYK